MSRVAEIARALDVEHDPDREPLEAFVRRRFGGELASTVCSGLMLAAWRGEFIEFLADLLDEARTASIADHQTIGNMISIRRSRGYDADFEAFLACHWQCASCNGITTPEGLVLNIADPARYPACPVCLCEEISPMDTEPKLATVKGGRK